MWADGGSPELSASILGDAETCSRAMRRVVTEWPVACSINLTELPSNKAWLGQAACCIWAGVSEDNTRRGWASLSDMQRARANAIAEALIAEWRGVYKGAAFQMELAYA